LVLFSWLALALAAWTLWRWLRRDPDKNPLEARFPLAALAVYLGIAALCYLPTWRTDRAAARAGRAISQIEGVTLEYRCGSVLNVFFDRDTDFAIGYVRWKEDGSGPEHSSKLRHETCAGLLKFLAAPDDLQHDRREKVLAIHVLSHEARHMLGEPSEARADCQALQRNAALARALGASQVAARELALAYWSEIYPHLSGGYFSTDCKAGGSLDEKLPSSPWNLAR
jgi:hypothetical protein